MIEFILGLMMVISFFFFYVKLAAVFAVANYIHYATFMAARAYQSSAGSIADQKSNAEAVLSSMIAGRWKNLIKAKGGDDGTITGASIGPGTFSNDNKMDNWWNQGVSFHFQASVSLYPWNKSAPPIVLDLTSESWQGREEATDECRTTQGKLKASTHATQIYWENGNGGC